MRSLRAFLAKENYASEARRLGIAARLDAAAQALEQVNTPEYLASLHGSLGLHPLLPLEGSGSQSFRGE